ncbi:MAG: nucleotide exchange factor GrpE [Woeseiaceae bacterium]|nr:nucleotide exchange factor GrpE [Woeseiaceae bacterium]
MNGQPDRPAENDGNDEKQAAAEDTGKADPVPAADVVDAAAWQQKADENWQKYLRTAAELENVRKRAARDVEHAHKFALERFAGELLAVLDSLEACQAAGEEAGASTLFEGNEATLKQLLAVLERFGIEELDPQGEPFDPALHEAMTVQPSETVEPGSVITVFQKGYALNGRLLRPARVVVAAEQEGSADAG